MDRRRLRAGGDDPGGREASPGIRQILIVINHHSWAIEECFKYSFIKPPSFRLVSALSSSIIWSSLSLSLNEEAPPHPDWLSKYCLALSFNSYSSSKTLSISSLILSGVSLCSEGRSPFVYWVTPYWPLVLNSSNSSLSSSVPLWARGIISSFWGLCSKYLRSCLFDFKGVSPLSKLLIRYEWLKVDLRWAESLNS